MNHPDNAGKPTFVPDNTRELSIGEKIENGDLKWHQPAREWAEIQILGYRVVKASQKGAFSSLYQLRFGASFQLV